MENKEKTAAITHLMRREIQAPMVSALIKGFVEEFGTEKALAVAKKIICKDAVKSGRALAKQYAGNSLDELLKIVEEIWAEDGTMEIENVSLSQGSLKFDVTRCGYAEMYEQLDIKELGSLLSCCRDFAFMDGFNPELKLVRTKAIMDGDDICDFCYKFK
jgi:UDP-N-acetylmuramyl pentapeptide synthase